MRLQTLRQSAMTLRTAPKARVWAQVPSLRCIAVFTPGTWPIALPLSSINTSTTTDKERRNASRDPPIDDSEIRTAVEVEKSVLKGKNEPSAYLRDPDESTMTTANAAHKETLKLIAERGAMLQQEVQSGIRGDSYPLPAARVMEPAACPVAASCFPGAIPELTEFSSDRSLIVEYNTHTSHSHGRWAGMGLGSGQLDAQEELRTNTLKVEQTTKSDGRPLPNPNSGPYKTIQEMEMEEEEMLDQEYPAGDSLVPASTRAGFLYYGGSSGS